LIVIGFDCKVLDFIFLTLHSLPIHICIIRTDQAAIQDGFLDYF